eukprot:c27699_g1_i1 orf=134-313(+)
MMQSSTLLSHKGMPRHSRRKPHHHCHLACVLQQRSVSKCEEHRLITAYLKFVALQSYQT